MPKVGNSIPAFLGILIPLLTFVLNYLRLVLGEGGWVNQSS